MSIFYVLQQSNPDWIFKFSNRKSYNKRRDFLKASLAYKFKKLPVLLWCFFPLKTPDERFYLQYIKGSCIVRDDRRCYLPDAATVFVLQNNRRRNCKTVEASQNIQGLNLTHCLQFYPWTHLKPTKWKQKVFSVVFFIIIL